MVTLYFALDHHLEESVQDPLSRMEILDFESQRIALKGLQEAVLTHAQRRLEEFATYSQGPTSGSYLSARLQIFLEVVRPPSVDPSGDPESA